MELTTATESLAQLVEPIGDEVLVLTTDGEPLAAIVSLKHIDRESLALSTNPEFMAIIEAARREIAAGRTLTLEGCQVPGVEPAS